MSSIGADDAEAFAATQRACAAVGWGYRRVGVADPVLTANVRWLSRYRHPRSAGHAGRSADAGVSAGPVTLMAGVAGAGDPIAVLPALYHLLWRGVLTADLAVRLPLAPGARGPGGAVSGVPAAGRARHRCRVGLRRPRHTVITALGRRHRALAAVTGEVVAMPWPSCSPRPASRCWTPGPRAPVAEAARAGRAAGGGGRAGAVVGTARRRGADRGPAGCRRARRARGV